MEKISAAELLLAVLVVLHCLLPGATANISVLFLLGDSLVDFGNINAISTTYAKANFPPYGIDFPFRIPAGRFTNGGLIPDFILSYLGLPSPRPYLSATRNATQGVNFASAGSGLFDSTGNVYSLFTSKAYPRPLPLQVQNFIQVKKELITDIGEPATLDLLNEALFYISIGSNDIANNYYSSNSTLQEQYTICEFKEVLLMIYDKQLQKLHREGARKFVIVSLFPLGCSPSFLVTNNISEPGRCDEVRNNAAQEFNCRLANLVLNLTTQLPNATFLYANSYDVPRDIVRNPETYRFAVSNVGCCNFIGPGPKDNRLIPVCLPASPTCANRSEYVYWDEFHPSSRTNSILADLFWNGSTEYIQPTNIQQLSAM